MMRSSRGLQISTIASALAMTIVLSFPMAAPAQPDGGRDSRLTLRVRQVLKLDPALAALPNLGVSVRSGVGDLWGSVPSADLARRAEKQIRLVPGISEVRSSELYIESPGDPIVQFLGTPVRRASTGCDPLWILSNRPPSRPEEPAADPATAARGIALMPPILIAPLSRVESQGNPEFRTAIQQLQDRELRFRLVQVEVEGGAVFLRRGGARSEDVFELAQRISRMPGVDRVSVMDPR